MEKHGTRKQSKKMIMWDGNYIIFAVQKVHRVPREDG